MLERPKLSDVLLLIVLGGLIYLGSLTVPFTYDDIHAIVNNPQVTSIDQSLQRLFAPRGFTFLTFAINHQLSGFAVLSYHVVNILIHLGCGVLVFLLLRRFFDGHRWLSLFGAAVFVAHPLQTQAVTYLVQRMASLATLLVLLSVYCFLRAREALGESGFTAPRHLSWYAGCLTAALFAVLAKENAAVVPALLLLVAWFRERERFSIKSELLYLAPFVLGTLIVAVYLLVSGNLLGSSMRMLELFVSADSGHTEVASAIPQVRLKYFLTQLVVFWHYVRLLLFPWGQMLDYSYPLIQDLLDWRVILSVLGLAGVAWGAVRSRNRYLTFALLWVLIGLSIESSVFPLEPIFEHRLYLPMFGFVVGFCEVWRRTVPERYWRYACASLVLVLCVLTVARNQLWRDSVALWSDNLARVPYSYRVKLLLADALLREGREPEWVQLVEEVVRQEPSPAMIGNMTYRDNLLELGKAYIRFGQAEKAVEVFRRAVVYYPRNAMTFLYLGSAYEVLGDRDSARRYVARARDLDPRNETILREYERLAR